jgi:integrase
MEPHTVLWDKEVRGFCARRQFDVVTYSVVFRTFDGIQRWHRIGRHGVWTPVLARREAQRVLRARDLGEDPSAERKALRSAPTILELCNEYQKRDNGKRSATIKSDRSRIKLHIVPKLGKLKVTAVTSDHVEDFMRSLSAGSAKRTIGTLGAIFSWAVKRKMRSDNPVTSVEKPKDVKKTRRLSETEYSQLSKAIGDVHNRTVADVFLALAISGWRSSEVTNLRWIELDLPRQIARLGETKSGMSVRPLSAELVKILEAQPKNGEYVFSRGAKPIFTLRPHWLKLGMPKDVTPHSLRHSFASLAGDLGLPDHTISRLLGHSQSSMTSRYIHMEKSVIEASDIVAQQTLRLMKA